MIFYFRITYDKCMDDMSCTIIYIFFRNWDLVYKLFWRSHEYRLYLENGGGVFLHVPFHIPTEYTEKVTVGILFPPTRYTSMNVKCCYCKNINKPYLALFSYIGKGGKFSAFFSFFRKLLQNFLCECAIKSHQYHAVHLALKGV
jgi:hypothetical protein